MTYKEFIESQRAMWVGSVVRYRGIEYTVVDVDYNGGLLIDKKAEFTDTTAVSKFQLDAVVSKPASPLMSL